MQFINTNTPINTNNPNTSGADTPQPAPTMTPEQMVEQLRAIRSQIGQVNPITPKQGAGFDTSPTRRTKSSRRPSI